MLIGRPVKRPDLERIRRLKRSLREALELSDDVLITVTELACLETDCAPVETVFGLLRPGAQPLQHKVHKSTGDIDRDDLTSVCVGWGFDVQASALSHPASKET